MLFFFVVPFWAMAFFLGLFLLVFPAQRFAASCLILISTCAAVGSVLASGTDARFRGGLARQIDGGIAAVGMIAGIMVGGFYCGLFGMKLAVRFQTGAR